MISVCLSFSSFFSDLRLVWVLWDWEHSKKSSFYGNTTSRAEALDSSFGTQSPPLLLPSPTASPSHLCLWNYPEEMDCMTQSWNGLWELLSPKFELFINKEVGPFFANSCKRRWGDGPRLGGVAAGQPRRSLSLWLGGTINDSTILRRFQHTAPHTTSEKEKSALQHNSPLLPQTQASLQSAWRSKATQKPTVTYFLEGQMRTCFQRNWFPRSVCLLDGWPTVGFNPGCCGFENIIRVASPLCSPCWDLHRL